MLTPPPLPKLVQFSSTGNHVDTAPRIPGKGDSEYKAATVAVGKQASGGRKSSSCKPCQDAGLSAIFQSLSSHVRKYSAEARLRIFRSPTYTRTGFETACGKDGSARFKPPLGICSNSVDEPRAAIHTQVEPDFRAGNGVARCIANVTVYPERRQRTRCNILRQRAAAG